MTLILAKIDEWQFDSFELAEATGGRPLSTLGFYLLKKGGLVPGKFGFNENKLARWGGVFKAVIYWFYSSFLVRVHVLTSLMQRHPTHSD